MKAMIGQLNSFGVNEPAPNTYVPSMEFMVLLYEDNGQQIETASINVSFTASTNQNQLLPLAKDEVIQYVASRLKRTISVNDIKSAVLQ